MQAMQILRVEDTLRDVKLMEHWLSASDLVDQLRVVRDGEQALELLRRERESRQLLGESVAGHLRKPIGIADLREAVRLASETK